jgi:uncharacterized protein
MATPDCQGGIKVALFLNHRCNLRCRYCYNGAAFDRPMSSATARRAVDFAFAQSAGQPLILSFFGGEPLLEIDRIEEVVDLARDQAARRGQLLSFSLSTNATIIDERRLRLLASADMRVQVSIDGTEEAHAQRRFANGRSSWRRATANLTRMLARDINVRVVAVVDPANAHLLPASFESLRAAGARRIHFVPNLAADWNESAQHTLEQGLAALANGWADCLRANHDVRLDPFHGKVAAHVMVGTRSPARCGFGARELAISPRGRIYPCNRIVKGDDDDAMCLGDLDAGVDEDRRRMVVAARDQGEPECAECDLRRRCSQQCGCTNYEQTGHPGHVPPALCAWERAVIAEADRIANQLYAENDPAFLRRFYAPGLAQLHRDAT